MEETRMRKKQLKNISKSGRRRFHVVVWSHAADVDVKAMIDITKSCGRYA